ncbi:aldo/keto reductase [Dactylosporangium sp. CA-233914]|uniref:aldo/keto reductase n=1 Tax=Dactylosporangium sp. CA-233914 TaxID=3239934 RepID=UPI003D8EE6DB
MTTMRRTLGCSGIEVSLPALGGNVFGPPRLDASATREVIAAALDLGVDFIDTANVYNSGESERLLGQALGARRQKVVLATKFNLTNWDRQEPVAHYIRQQAEESLSRLSTDYIDLYQLHFPNGSADVADLLAAAGELVAEGKIRAFGVCNYSAWRLAETVQLSTSEGLAAIATVQNYYHLLARQVEAEVLPYAQRAQISVLPYHPLGGGFLTGKYRQGQPAPSGTRGANGSRIIQTMSTPENWRLLDQLTKIAADHGHTIGELAIAWLANQPIVGAVIAGASNVDQLRSNVTACGWALTQDVLDEIDRIVAPNGIASPERMPYAAG